MRHSITIQLILWITLNLLTSLKAQEIEPPTPKKVPHSIQMHGDTWDDPYYWIHEKDNREVINYISAENGYTKRMMRSTELFQKKLLEEMKARYSETDQSLPIKRGDYFYYSRREKDASYSLYCRKKGSLKAKEEVLLNMNDLARRNAFTSLSLLKVSPNHELLAYAIDFTGNEQPTLFFKNLKTGQTYEDQIKNLASVEWLNTNQEVYYATYDSLHNAKKVYRHKIGDAAEKDPLVFQSDDLSVYLSKTSSKAYITLTASSRNESYQYFTDANKPNDRFKLFQKKEADHQYSLSHLKGDNYFHIYSNHQDDQFKIYKTSLKNTAKKNWEVLYETKGEAELEGYVAFRDYLVLKLRQNGLVHFRVINRISQESYKINFPENPYSVGIQEGKPFEDNILRFYYTSYVQPTQVFDFNLSTKQRTLVRQYKVYGSEGYAYNPDDYETKRIFAPARDGVKIPISIVYKKGMKLDGNNPVFLTGYGSYGMTYEPSFNADFLTLLDRGIIVGQAHIRGSGYFGKKWYDAGKMMKKKNSIYDFIDASTYLIEAGYTSKEKLIAQGGSAGGMLMGAVANEAPELYHAIIAQVPAMDLLTFLTDDKFPGSKYHHQEWGNPNENKEHYDYVKSYAPYENIEAKAYPHMLLTAGFQDVRVRYMEPTKYIARMRELKTDDNLLLLNMVMSGGHGLGSGRYNGLKQSAFVMAFVFKVLGIESDYSSIKGVVYDENNQPLPFATVVLAGTTNGTTTNAKGEYQFELKKGKYTFVYQFVGFEEQKHEVDLSTPQVLDVKLKTESTLLKAVTISDKFNDPAYGIIKKAQEKRKEYLNGVKTYRVNAYMKSINRFDEMPKKLPPFIPKSDLPDSTDIGLIYLSESQSVISKKGKDNIKEEMISSKVAGRSQGYSWNRA
ncbi:MAG: DUF5686 family protein, partial [Flammeovirgaceae bacterium]